MVFSAAYCYVIPWTNAVVPWDSLYPRFMVFTFIVMLSKKQMEHVNIMRREVIEKVEWG